MEACMWCVENTCVEECACDMENEEDPCWEGCMNCWDPMGCHEMTDMGEDDEWASEADALDCLVETMPCADACDGLEAPSEGCLEYLDDEGMLREHSMNSAPMMVKSLNKIVLAKEGGDDKEGKKEKKEKKEKKHGDDDDMDMEACMWCVENTCVEECACDMENEEDPCWE